MLLILSLPYPYRVSGMPPSPGDVFVSLPVHALRDVGACVSVSPSTSLHLHTAQLSIESSNSILSELPVTAHTHKCSELSKPQHIVPVLAMHASQQLSKSSPPRVWGHPLTPIPRCTTCKTSLSHPVGHSRCSRLSNPSTDVHVTITCSQLRMCT